MGAGLQVHLIARALPLLLFFLFLLLFFSFFLFLHFIYELIQNILDQCVLILVLLLFVLVKSGSNAAPSSVPEDLLEVGSTHDAIFSGVGAVKGELHNLYSVPLRHRFFFMGTMVAEEAVLFFLAVGERLIRGEETCVHSRSPREEDGQSRGGSRSPSQEVKRHF